MKYTGERNSDGHYHGQGTFSDADGTTYTGEWKDGHMHGQGTLTVAHGPPITGEWKDGVPVP